MIPPSALFLALSPLQGTTLPDVEPLVVSENLFSPSALSGTVLSAAGAARKSETRTGRKNCQTRRTTMRPTPAPITLRMPISFVRRRARKAARPNRPINARASATAAKAAITAPIITGILKKKRK